jgi:hypothetical protein
MLTVISLALVLAAGAAEPDSVRKAPQQPHSVDWFQVLESLAIPSSAEFTNQTWQQAGALPWVTWASNDVMRRGTSIERRGKVVVTVGGKPVQVAGRIHAWEFGASGATVGVVHVWLSSVASAADLSVDVEGDMSKADVDWAAISCGANTKTNGAKFYQVEPAGKKTFWLLHTWKCQTNGCAVEFKAFYQQPRPADLGTATSPCPA